MAISPSTIEEVQRTANVYDIISDYLDLKKAGSSYTALCPFHSEKSPSFMVSPQKNIWKCFGCGKSGDAIKFIMEYEGLNFADAIIKIANKYGIEVKYTKSNNQQEKLKGLYEISKKIAFFYKEQLKKSSTAKNYIKEREILPTVLDIFDIGYSPEEIKPLMDFCESENISIEELKKIGLITEKENGRITDKFAGRLIFPIKDYKGRVVAFGGRAIKENKLPKYLNSPETEIYQKRKILYGFFESKDYIRESHKVIVVEGYIDLLSLYQIGIKNVVATLGTALTNEHGKLLSKFSDEAILMFDSDKAGKKAVIEASKILLNENLDVKYCIMPEGEDPDTVAKKGFNYVNDLINNSKDIFQFLLEKIDEYSSEMYINNDKVLKKKKEIIDLYINLLNHVKDNVKRGILLKQLSDITGIPIELLNTVKKPEKQSLVKDDEENKYLSYNEKLILKTLLNEKEKVLKEFSEFDKIKGSVYFHYLLNLILGENINEQSEEYREIQNFYEKVDIQAAVEALHLLHKKWIEEEAEITAVLSFDKDDLLKEILEKKKLSNNYKFKN
jgi:DNA primase